MRDHLKKRTPELKVQRVNGAIFTDSFFAPIKSIRGYACWNLYCYQTSGIAIHCLQARWLQGHVALLSYLYQHGVPKSIKTDNVPEFKRSKWNSVLHKLQVGAEFTEIYHLNQNLAERRGGRG